ncbi:MAG: GYF domain-containing protein [Muribaculaceae bacterium]|nr:GYF domain-containing protein [Muribaculaceae bacterium]
MTDFSSIDRLMEIGMSMGLAQQMVNTMNQTMNNMQIAGVNAGTTGKTPPVIPPSTNQWYAAIDGHLAGPLSERDIHRLIERDLLVGSTLLWCNGMKAWKKAEDIPEINKELLLK